jgi:hypothetical protein
MNVLAVAEMLGKFEWEVLQLMSPDEFARWLAYITINNRKMKK